MHKILINFVVVILTFYFLYYYGLKSVIHLKVHVDPDYNFELLRSPITLNEHM